MNIRGIRSLTGLSQAKFSKKYGIPLTTLQNWECEPSKRNYRKCPEYMTRLLEKVVRADIEKEENMKNIYYDEKHDIVYVRTELIVPQPFPTDKGELRKMWDMPIKDRIDKYAPDNLKKEFDELMDQHKGCRISEFTTP